MAAPIGALAAPAQCAARFECDDSCAKDGRAPRVQ